MSDDKTPMPEQPKTVQLPAPDRIEILLQEMRVENRDSFKRVNERIDSLSTAVEVLNYDASDSKSRIGRLERKADETDMRHTRHSDGARQLSQTDLETQAALAGEVEARKALALKVEEIGVETKAQSVEIAEVKSETKAQTEMLTTLLDKASKIAANPIVRSVAVMTGTAIMTWLAAHGGKL